MEMTKADWLEVAVAKASRRVTLRDRVARLATPMISLRTGWKAWLLGWMALTTTFSAAAEEPTVPLQLQVDLTVKLLAYTRDPPADVLHIGILTKTRSAESLRFATELKIAFDRVDAIAGRPHDQAILEWAGPATLADETARRGLYLLYVTPGLDSEVPVMARALEETPLITVAASDSYVPSGAILGFELVSGHPRMVFNLTQARKQNVTFRAAVMKLMRIVQ